MNRVPHQQHRAEKQIAEDQSSDQCAPWLLSTTGNLTKSSYETAAQSKGEAGGSAENLFLCCYKPEVRVGWAGNSKDFPSKIPSQMMSRTGYLPGTSSLSD